MITPPQTQSTVLPTTLMVWVGLYLLFLTELVFRPIWSYFQYSLGVLPNVNITLLATGGLALTLMGIIRIYILKRRVGYNALPMTLSQLLIFLVVLIQLGSLPSLIPNYTSELLVVTSFTLITSSLFWVIGAHVVPIYSFCTRSLTLRLLTFSLYILFMATILFGYLLEVQRTGAIDLLRVRLYQEEGSPFVYLLISDALALFSFWVVSLIKNWPLKGIVVLATAIALLITNSRTALFVYPIVNIILFCFVSPPRIRPWAILTSALILLLLFPYVRPLLSDPDAQYSRTFNIFINPTQDRSFVGRGQYLSESWQRLEHHWLTGSFMPEVTKGGGVGAYAHNWLSFWESYGLVPFLISIGLMVWTIVFGFSALNRKTVLRLNSPTEEDLSAKLKASPRQGVLEVKVSTGSNSHLLFALLGIALFSIISIATTRAYIWPYIWFVFGALPAVHLYLRRKAHLG